MTNLKIIEHLLRPMNHGLRHGRPLLRDRQFDSTNQKRVLNLDKNCIIK